MGQQGNMKVRPEMAPRGSTPLGVEICPNGLRWELGLSLIKKTTRGCLQDYSAGYYPFKTFNGRLNAIKALGIIRNCPFKALKPTKKR